MPSFWEGLKRLTRGEPVFTNADSPVDGKEEKFPVDEPAILDSSEPTPGENPILYPDGRKILPEVVIDEWDVDIRETHMECRVQLENRTDMHMQLDKVRIFKTTRELDDVLRPGQVKQYLIYSGAMPQNTYENKIEIQYKAPNGDYFSSTHYIEFKQEAPNAYTIIRIKFQPPVRDI